MSSKETIYGIILAAGKGTRLSLDMPKVLAPVHGKPMIHMIIDAMHEAGINDIVVVVGHRAEEVKQSIMAAGYSVTFAFQEQQIGTGNAVKIAMEYVSDVAKTVLITYGDKPLITAHTFESLIEKQQQTGAVAVVPTVFCPNPSEMGFGRIKRDKNGNIMRMVEQKECSEEDLLITECNGGPVAHDAVWLRDALGRSKTGPSGEIYLTDLIRLAYEEGERVEVVSMSDLDEAHGVNTLTHLQQAEDILKNSDSFLSS